MVAKLKLGSVLACAGLVCALFAAAPSAAQSGSEDPCVGVPAADFSDRGRVAEAHRASVDCVAFYAVTAGVGDGQRYGPRRTVTRGQMATFIVNVLLAANQPIPGGGGDDEFDDIAGSVHRQSINRLARIGVVRGTGANYRPNATVRRDQMASFLLQAAEWASGVQYDAAERHFSDVDPDNVHADNINAAYERGLVRGTRKPSEGQADGRYSPAGDVTREAMASFLVNELRFLQTAYELSTRVAPADFDGDGFDDLVLGAPWDRVGEKRNAGSVSVLYGADGGVTAHDQLWHRDRKGVKGVAAGNRDLGYFGYRVGSGDFDGDGYADLFAAAESNPSFDGIPRQVASINVLYGSRDELTAHGDQLWHADRPGVKGEGGAGGGAPGDFNRDGYDDLAFVGDGLHVLYGSLDGLTAAGDLHIQTSDRGVKGNDAPFHGQMAIGDFDGDRIDDLAVGRPGAVHVFFGSTRGLTRRDQLLRDGHNGIPDRGPDQGWGGAMAAGNFDGRDGDDLAVDFATGDHPSDGDITRAIILRSDRTSRGLTSDGMQTLTPEDFGESTNSEQSSTLDFADGMQAADFDRDGRDDLAISMLVRDVEKSEIEAVTHIARDSSTQLVEPSAAPRYAADSGSVGELGVADYNGDDVIDLTWIPGRRNGTARVFHGSEQGLAGQPTSTWRRDTPHIKGDGSWSTAANYATPG